ncbi:MAG: hypothetical protein IJT36_06615 [Alphaproteobacteria bacterium]|nr:hypothetical protein [Alphaproteobacteria bacterium]
MKKLATTVALTALFSTMMVYDANAGILSRNNTITAANLQAAFGGNIAIAKNWKTTESKILYDVFCTAKKAFTKKLPTISKTKAEKTFNELLSLLEKALIDIYQCENEKTLTKKTTNLVSYWTQKYDTVGSINSVQKLPDYDLETFSDLSELLNQDKFAVFKETFLNLNLPDQFWTKSGTSVVEGAKKTFGIILILQCLMGKDDPRAVVATSSNFTPEYTAETVTSSSSSSEEGNWMFNGNSSTTSNNTTTAPVTFQGTPATTVNLNETQATALAVQQAAAAEAAKKQAEEQAAAQLAAQQQQATLLAAQQAAVQQLIQQATAAVSSVQQIIPQVQNNLASRQYAMAERLAQQAVQQASVAKQFSQQAIQQATASQQATLIQQANATQQAVQQIAQQAASLQASVTQTISQLRGSYLRAYQLQKQQLR